MLTFDDLPVELALKVLSYLPQRCLPTIAQVSERWNTLAYDPSLWKEVCIDSSTAHSAHHVRDMLDRATMIRKLEISAGPLYLEEIALASAGFKTLKEIVIPGSVLSHASMPVILRNCESLITVVLRGGDSLLTADIRALEHLKRLKALIASRDVYMRDDILRQVCISCPDIEQLHFNSGLISRRDHWEYLRRLRHLTSLSISRISTSGLLVVSGSCGSLELLSIGDVWNENDVAVAHALEKFRKLRVVSVGGNCGTGWLDSRFRTPRGIQRFCVPRLCAQEQQLMLLAESCRDELLSVAFSASVLTPLSLNALYSCRNLQTISVRNLCGKGLSLSMLLKFPNLARAHLHVSLDPTEAVRKLTSLVDILDSCSRGGTRLELRIRCSTQPALNAMIRELRHFKEFLALNTHLSAEHLRNLEKYCQRIGDTKIYWLPIGMLTTQVVQTSFPVISKKLKHLVLELSEH
ncbi:hypothetical protein HPB50_002420 [Hyalomma asiaticum]|uniref:Uncharacterized protein n=1 Tax=Hyalomma asiaticum TaxID=266040 RepID=A0ACB7SDH8_HYAAI|nr:hypothetical protein HPB50_002420 [Hyalomma asiaticum]